MLNLDLREYGRTGLKWSAGYVYDEFLPALAGSRGRKIYREMSDNDPIIGAYLQAIEQILREARWDVKPADSTDAECKKDAEFLKRCISSMSHSWSDFIAEVLSMFVYGWSYFEQVFERSDDGKIVWKKIPIRAQESLDRWEFDESGGIKGMWQRPSPRYESIYLPMMKCLLFRTKPNKDNPEGKSILRTAFRPWFFRKNLQELEGIGLERDLAGIPVMTCPEGFNIASVATEDQLAIKWAKDIVSNLRNDEQAGVLLPAGWKLELLASPGKKQFDTSAIINRYSKEIAVTVLAQFILLGMERTGSYALATQQTDMFYLSLEGWGNSIASTINRYAIPTLFGLNGISSKLRPLPYIVHSMIGRPTLKDLSTYVSSLVNADALVVDDDMKNYLKRYGKLEEFGERSS